MEEKHGQVAELLIDLECELRNMGVWSRERPSETALASEQPFGLDTLEFEEWLQFVFIERMHTIVERRLPLPQHCGVAPMAEEHFRRSQLDPTVLIAYLHAIDRILSS